MMADDAAKGGDRRRDAGIRRSGPLGETPGNGEALPQLLAETVGSLGGPDASSSWATVLTDEDRRRLSVAVGRRSRPLLLDLELAADMVESVLPESLAAMVADSRSRRRLAEQIARTLLEDPRSAARLQTLVSALSSAATSSDAGRPGSSP